MDSSLKLALVAALPAEFFQFCLFAYPVDKGFSPDTFWGKRALAEMWLAMHWPALAALHWMEVRGVSAADELLAFFASGYIGMVLLLAAVLLAMRWTLRIGRHQPRPH